MESQRLNLLIQIATSIALLAGLGLIVWELRQARAFMEFELVDRTFAEGLETWRVNLGENPMAVYAKACQGEELSQEDHMILANYFRIQMNLVLRNIATLNLLEVPAEGSKTLAQFAFIEIFQLDEGKRWFEWWEKRVASNQGPALQSGLRMARDALKQGVPPCAESRREWSR